MNLLDKIDFLMHENRLNKHTLADKSGIPYTTIMGWFRRGCDSMSLSTFRRLCDFFHVTMDSMARDYMDIEYYDPNSKDFYTNEDERMLLKAFRQADLFDRTSVLRTLDLEDEKKERKSSVS